TQFRELEKVDSDPSEARTKMGLIYFEKGQLDRAETEFNLVLASAPNNVRVRYYLAAVYAEQGETQRALEGFSAVTPDSEYFVDAQVRRALPLHNNKPRGAPPGLAA